MPPLYSSQDVAGIVKAPLLIKSPVRSHHRTWEPQQEKSMSRDGLFLSAQEGLRHLTHATSMQFLIP